MVNQENVEKLFDIINEACCFLFDKYKMDYLTGLLENTRNILEAEIKTELKEEDIKPLQGIYDKLEDVSFNQEEVRKAMQYLLVRAFKEIRMINQVTPDTLGFLLAYLANKFFKDQKIAIMDMCLGTGNLITTIANQMNDPILYGVEIDSKMADIARMNASMQDYDMNIFLGDTLESHLRNMDLIVGDIPGYFIDKEKTMYFPYEAILYHKDSLKDDGYMFLIVPNDFFSHDTGFFKKAFDADMQMFGLLELPDNIFKEEKKCIILIQKSKVKKKNVLMVKIPDFNNQELMNNTIRKIEEWFRGENYYD